jgi:hypothetical protein
MDKNQGGYRSLKLKNVKVKKARTFSEKLNTGNVTLTEKLGIEEAKELVQTFKTSITLEQDGIILSLLSQGFSQMQIRGLLGVGGYRVSRLAKFQSESQEG